MKIVSRYDSSKVIYEDASETMRETVETAVKSMANLSRANLSRANLSWANLTGANLTGADLSWAHLTGADPYGANLSWANLTGANLYGANLSWADLYRANLSEANLSKANLSKANLSKANLTGAILPDGRTLPEFIAWMPEGLLVQGGKSVTEVAATWGNHTWSDCPMHCAFGADDINEVPECHRSGAALFVALFDGGHLPKPEAKSA
jgi:hypothetical protein